MIAKIEITGRLIVKTGLHIGGTSEFAAIGALDSPVVRDVISGYPMIPGSSIKGKIRSLLAKNCGDGHIPEKASQDREEIVRIFGGGGEKKKSSRFLFTDMVQSNVEELEEQGVDSPTEIKFENNIGRLSAVATPRQIERVIRGSEFKLQIIYNAENKEEIVDDFQLLSDGLKLLTYDYLGGSGSRGYGKIAIENLYADAVCGDIDDILLEECRHILKEV